MSVASLDVARARGDLHDLAFVLGFAMQLRLLRREYEAVLGLAEESIALCREQGYPYWGAWGLIASGAALVERGDPERGLARLADGVARYRATGAEVGLGHFLAVHAEALGRAGAADAGLAVVEEARALVARNGNHYITAELHRLRGTLLASRHSPDPEAAEAAFREAADVAKRQAATALELRALTGLTRLLAGQGRGDAVRGALAEVYAAFGEGLETADLARARALLG
jgi:predicted ATPase